MLALSLGPRDLVSLPSCSRPFCSLPWWTRGCPGRSARFGESPGYKVPGQRSCFVQPVSGVSVPRMGFGTCNHFSFRVVRAAASQRTGSSGGSCGHREEGVDTARGGGRSEVRGGGGGWHLEETREHDSPWVSCYLPAAPQASAVVADRPRALFHFGERLECYSFGSRRCPGWAQRRFLQGFVRFCFISSICLSVY